MASLPVLFVSAASARADGGSDEKGLELAKTATGVSVASTLSVSLSPVPATAIPGDHVTYQATVTNSGETIAIAGDFVARNDTERVKTLHSWYDAVAVSSTSGDAGWERGLGVGDGCRPPESGWVAHDSVRRSWGTPRRRDCRPFAATGGAGGDYVPVDPAPASPRTLDLAVTPVAAAGVAYGTQPDRMIGTVIAPHSVATWHYIATMQVTAADAMTLLNPLITRTAANILHVEITPSGEHGSQHNYAATDLTSLLRGDTGHAGGGDERASRGNSRDEGCGSAPNPGDSHAEDHGDRDNECGSSLSADLQASSVHVTILPPSGAPVTFTSADTPALAALAPGASVQVSTPYAVPAAGRRRSDQTDAAYLAQLGRIDGSSLTGRASATASSPIVGVVGATARPVSTTEHIPLLQLTKSGPASVDARTTATYSLALRNAGGSAASAIALVDRFPGGATGTISGAPTTIDPGTGGQATSQFAIPDGRGRVSLTDTAAVSWQDANHNAYGPIVSTFTSLINEANQPPIAGTASATVEQGQTLTLPVADLLQHDTLAFPGQPGETLAVTAVTATSDTHGTVSLANGSVSYVPDSGYTGPARFTYTVCNNGTTAGQPDPKCAVGDVDVAVTISVIRPPTADPLKATTPENSAVAIKLTGTDPAGRPLTFAVGLTPQHGALSGTPPALSYMPAANFTGTDTFTYTASNGGASSPPATVTLTITEVNQPPNAGTAKFSLQQASQATGGPLTLFATERLNQSIAKVTFPNGVATVDSSFVKGLPQQGPDSAIFAPDGNLLVSNPDAGTISLVDPVTGGILNPQINTTLLPDVADLALDPSGRAVWAISLGHSSTDAISRISLDDGTVDARNPDGIIGVGGIAFDAAGKRLFVSGSDGTGTINEISPTDGHLQRSIDVTGFPDSLTFDPSTRHLFASRCNDLPPGQGTNGHALCEIDIGTDSGPTLRLVGLREPQGDTPDGIAADGKGSIYIARDLCCIDRMDLATNNVFPVAQVPNADDITPLTGLGAPPPPAVLRFAASDLISVSTPGPPDEATQTLTVTSVTPTATTHGTVSLADGTITYTPDPSYTGPADFSYQICDDGTTAGRPDPKCATGAVEVTIVANQAPSATSQQVTTPENTPVGVKLAGNDPGGAALTFGIAQSPQHGLLSGSTPTVTYTPSKDFFGGDSFAFTASNGNATSPVATVTLVVSAVNQPPTAGDVTASTHQGAPLSLPAASILRSDTPGPRNEADQTLTITAVNPTAATHGTVGLANGQVTYTPDASFSGAASFDYTVCDNGATDGKPNPKCANGKVNIAVQPTAPPVVRDDTTTTQEGSAVTVNILANDDPGSGQLDPSTLTVVGAPALGKATVVGPAVLYTPHAGSSGVDSFSYRVCNTEGACGHATVTVTITSTPKPPTGKDDSYTVATNESLQVPAPGILGNDVDPNAGDSLHVQLAHGPSAGSLLLKADGSFDYTPAASFSGYDHFTYRAVDDAGQASAVATVAIAVVGTPGPPTANGDTYSMQSGQVLNAPSPGTLGNDTAPDPADKLTAHLVSDTARGTLLLAPDGSFTYAPEPGFTGADSFTYQARDAEGRTSDPATVVITVAGGGLPTPTVSALSPSDGSRITGPVHLTAQLTPPATQTITSWQVSYRSPGGSARILATGTGTTVDASFDPTLLRDATYMIDIEAHASGGGVLVQSSSVIVDGSYKPGRYATTYQDLALNTPAGPLKLERTYDSTDKTDHGLGVGWSFGLTGFQVSTNGPLGAGGWSTYRCGTFPFLHSCYTSSKPHFVTITWPDGHLETFDFQPDPGSLLLPALTTAAFTPHPGATSTLQPVGDSSLLLTGGDFLAGGLLGVSGLYDPAEYLLTDHAGTQYLLDRTGAVLRVTDRNGNALSISPAGITASSGQSIAFQRDPAGRVASIVGPTGTITYSYSAAGDLTRVAYPNGGNQTFTYDANHDLISIAGGGDVLRTLHYDSSGRIIAVTDGNGNTSAISSNLAGHQQVLTDASGKLITVDTFDDRGDLVQQDKTFGGKTVTTKATFDSLGHQLTITDPLGHTTSQTYDAAFDVVTKTDAMGNTTTFSYNARGEPLTVTDPNGGVTTNTYDANGNLLTLTDPNHHTTTNTYDALGHLLTTTDPAGRTITRTYDTHGQVASLSDNAGHVMRQVVDANTGLVTSTTDPTGATTSFTYDADGNLTAITDANRHTRTATYDSWARVTSLTDSAGATSHLTYDGAGLLVALTDRNGATTKYSYDADSRLIAKTVPGAGTTTYNYDPLGRRVAAANANAKLTLTYDDAGRLLKTASTDAGTSSLPTTALSYTYDAAGNRTSTTAPGGTISYRYDRAGRLANLTDPAGGSFFFGYDPTGALTALSRPNGITDTTTYDPAGTVVSVHSNLGGALVNKADYTYNSAGLVSSITTTSGTTTYTYDAVSQLTGATYPARAGKPADTFTYDPVGNRTSDGSSPVGSFTYDSADRLQSDATATYAYDNEGDLLSRTVKATGATTRYTWSAEHQLVGIAYPTGAVATYKYDPFGRMVEVDERGAVTRYAYDGPNIVAEYDSNNQLSATYVTDPTTTRQRLEMTRNGQRYFYLTDAQRSTMALTTITGSVADSYTYDASGHSTVSGNVANPFTYTGQFFDPTAGLLLFPLRPEDPTMGRFLSEDPCLAVNPYPYVSNSAPNLVDPSGAELAETAVQENQSTCSALWAGATVVLGSWPLYTIAAYEFGLTAFDIGDLYNDRIGPGLNMEFLAQTIKTEAIVFLSNFPPKEGTPFAAEIAALRAAGYALKFCKWGTFVAPPGWKP